MSKKIAVIGAGAFGRNHVRVLKELADAPLAGLFDLDHAKAQALAAEFQTIAFGSLEEAIAAASGAVVAVPTLAHGEVGLRLLEAGLDILVEKPIAADLATAQRLVKAAAERERILQVGHLERFNPAVEALEAKLKLPLFFEIHRMSVFTPRSLDVDVVLDLMIHDLDILLAFVQSPVTRVDAVGVSVLSNREDIANARLQFANGCVANITASRISPERLRKIRVFSGGASPSYISLDYRAQEGFLYRIAQADEAESSLFAKLMRAKESTIVSEFAGRRIVRQPVPIAKEEPLRLELRHFVHCVQARQTPLVSGASAKDALDLAFEITRQIEASSAGSSLQAQGTNPSGR